MKEQEHVRFRHLKLGAGYATFAWKYSDEPNARYFSWSVAFCAPRDQFSRKKGRLITQGRLNRPPSRHIRIELPSDNPPPTTRDVVIAALDVCSSKHWSSRVPDWALQAIRRREYVL